MPQWQNEITKKHFSTSTRTENIHEKYQMQGTKNLFDYVLTNNIHFLWMSVHLINFKQANQMKYFFTFTKST